MRTLAEGFCLGDWHEDRDCKQWLIGSFRRNDLSKNHPLCDGRVEIKTATHSKGAERRQEDATSKKSGKVIEIILSGKFTMWFEIHDQVEQFDLDSRGNNYFVWPAGFRHWWRAQSDCEILSIHLP